MQRNPQAKSQANILMREMKAAGTPIKLHQALDTVAKMSGFRDWNAMAAAPQVAPAPMPTAPVSPSLPAGTLSPRKVTKLIELARDVIDSCDSTGCDGLTVADEAMAWKLKEFLGNLTTPEAPVSIPGEIARFDPATQVAIVWSVDDVQTVRPDLTDEEALDVLKQAKRKHDCEVGISWSTLRETAAWHFAERVISGVVTFLDEDANEVTRPSTVNLSRKGKVFIDGAPLRSFNSDGDGEFVVDGIPDQKFAILDGKLLGNEDDDDTEHSYQLRDFTEMLKSAGILPANKD